MEGESGEGTGLTYKKKDWNIRSAISIINAFIRKTEIFMQLNIIMVIQ